MGATRRQDPLRSIAPMGRSYGDETSGTLPAVTRGRFTCGRNRLPSQAGAPAMPDAGDQGENTSWP